MSRPLLAATALVALAGNGCSDGRTTEHTGAQTAACELVPVDGDPSCADLGYAHEYLVEPAQSAAYALDAFNTVTVTVGGAHFDWLSTLGIDAVIAHGGPNANEYIYQVNPTDPEWFSDVGLSAQLDPGTGQPYPLSKIRFCYDYDLQISASGTPSYERVTPWTVQKVALHPDQSVWADPVELALAAGETYAMAYRVTPVAGTPTTSDFAFDALITIRNPAPDAATITGISLANVPCMVDPGDAGRLLCAAGDTLAPVALAAGQQIIYAYHIDLPGADPSTTLSMHIDITSTGVPPGTTDYWYPIDFPSAVVTDVDRCASVSDDHAGALGTVCVGSVQSFEYTLEIGPYAECGTSHTFTNTATLDTCDRHLDGSDSVVVSTDVAACDVGCTLTPGYWKTHSQAGPAPYDDAWALLGPGQEQTAFYLSGMTYYAVLWQAPVGNAYFILAHAFIAAQLNGLNGASLDAVQSTMQAVANAFNTYTPTSAAVTAKTSAVRAQFLTWAATLDAFNNGLTGPGHCDE